MVSDTGPGIPPEQLEKVFDRFYQVEDGWKKEVSGTGIGLSLTKELTALHHGEILVESDIRKGSRFTVKLTVGKDHLKQQEYTLAESEESDDQSLIFKCSLSGSTEKAGQEDNGVSDHADRPIVLIIDDNQDIRKHLGESLAGDFIIREAGNGKEGLEKAQQPDPDGPGVAQVVDQRANETHAVKGG